MASIAREILQNSIDARAGLGLPVQVSFELRSVKRTKTGGWENLAAAIDACRKQKSADVRARQELDEAAIALKQKTITFLRVADKNTTGLHGDHWHALVKQQGVNSPERQTAGGSHGLGKSAAFLFSPLRTIFYWTRFQTERRPVELCQGKSILMSHLSPNDGKQTQGTGFYGFTDGCRELEDRQAPDYIRSAEQGAGRGNGTSLWIAGFDDHSGWQQSIAASVIANFFFAIQSEELVVTIEPDDDMHARSLIEIDAEHLEEWYDYLLDYFKDGDEYDRLAESFAYWDAVANHQPVAEREDKDLGHCKLWIVTGDDQPGNVALIRNTGMLISDDQKGLQRFPGANPFAAVCRFDSDKGSTFLRRMENPRHDQFEPDWLPESERPKGRTALKRIAQWIRSEVNEAATPPPPVLTTVIPELAQFLPDIEPDEAFAPAKPASGERKLGGVVVIKGKPRKRKCLKPPKPSPNHIGLRDVRFTAISEAENRYRFSFTPDESADAVIRLEEAGDSNPIPRDDLYEIAADGSKAPIGIRQLRRDHRVHIDFTSDAPIGDRAWRITALDARAPKLPIPIESGQEFGG